MKQTVAIVIFIGGMMIAESARAQDEVPAVSLQNRLVEGIVQISDPGEESVW